jgi:hypothetical protein
MLRFNWISLVVVTPYLGMVKEQTKLSLTIQRNNVC